MDRFELVIPHSIVEYMRGLPGHQYREVISLLGAVASEQGSRDLVAEHDNEFAVESGDWRVLVDVDRDNRRLVVLNIVPRTARVSVVD